MNLTDTNHLNLLFPQWQGSGPDNILFYGARKLQQHLDLPDIDEIEVPESNHLTAINDILGYHDILSQLGACADLIQSRAPETILVIGGDCGVEPIPVTFLNQQLKNDFALVWFDAHGDLNTPQSSPSGHFHGMPLRTICGQGDPAIINKCFSVLDPGQIILAGTRDLDPPEAAFVEQNSISCLSCHTMQQHPGSVSDAIIKKGFTNVYIHIDLDVLDPETYLNVKHPTPGGVAVETLLHCIRDLSARLNPVGAGIVEFVPEKDSGLTEIEKLINVIAQRK